MRLNLSPAERKGLRNALEVAFTQPELTIMLFEETGRSLANLTPLPGTMESIVFDVVARAEAQAWTDRLLLGAAAWRPEDPLLGTILRERNAVPGSGTRLSVSTGSLVSSGAGNPGDALQGIVRRASRFANVQQFLGRLESLQAQVCRIEVDGGGVGTGFLSAHDRVITNYHVRQLFGVNVQKVRCRFDYRELVLADGVAQRKGQEVALAADDWLVAESPYAGADVHKGGASPTANELDYAVLRLAEPVGSFASGRSEESPGAVARGFVAIPDLPPPAPGADLFVLQHPSEQPLMLAVGRVQLGAPQWRAWHDTRTEKGSSGSPCFDADLRLVGLHHATDPQDPKAPEFNQAIPIAHIAADLRNKNKL